jgi:hypothetical protein
VTFTYVLTIYLNWIHPFIFLPHSLPLLQRAVSAGFIVLFSYMNTKYIHHIHPPSLLPYAYLLPLLSTLGQNLFYRFSALHLKKKNIFGQRTDNQNIQGAQKTKLPQSE